MADVVVFVVLVGVVSAVLLGWRSVHNARASSRVWRVDGRTVGDEMQVVVYRGSEVKTVGAPVSLDGDFALDIELRRNDADELCAVLNRK